jgi:hypothetical protein
VKHIKKDVLIIKPSLFSSLNMFVPMSIVQKMSAVYRRRTKPTVLQRNAYETIRIVMTTSNADNDDDYDDDVHDIPESELKVLVHDVPLGGQTELVQKSLNIE